MREGRGGCWRDVDGEKEGGRESKDVGGEEG